MTHEETLALVLTCAGQDQPFREGRAVTVDQLAAELAVFASPALIDEALDVVRAHGADLEEMWSGFDADRATRVLTEVVDRHRVLDN